MYNLLTQIRSFIYSVDLFNSISLFGAILNIVLSFLHESELLSILHLILASIFGLAILINETLKAARSITKDRERIDELIKEKELFLSSRIND